jgi:lysophospholipase L1-like esterase
MTASGVFAMALAEAVLRFVPGLLSVELQQIVQADPDNYGVTHPHIGNLGTPNNTFIISGRDFRAANHTDGYGFRNAWPWPDRAEIVTVGDSVTFGYGVEDEQAWPALVVKALPQDPLVNLGLIGAGPQQYLRVYETFGVKLHPKLLLVGFLVRNDFWDANMFDRWLKSGAQGNYMVWRDFGRPRSTSLSMNQPFGDLAISLLWQCHLLATKSHLYNFLHYARRYLKGWRLSRPPESTIQTPDGTRLELALADFIDKTGEARPGQRLFDVTVEALQRLHSIAKANGTNVLVILQPSKEEVYLPPSGEPDADPGSPLRVKLGELGIPYLDLLPDFRSRAAKGEVLFFETDGHPNVRGYALIAELVIAHLEDNAKRYGLSG